MRRELPPRAHLEHLKKQAKELLDTYRRGDPDALRRVSEALPAFANLAHAASHPALALHDMQSVIAREYGFSSWRALRDQLDASEQQRLMIESLSRSIAEVTQQPLPPAVMAAITEWSQEGLDGTRLDAIALPERLPLLPVRNFLAAPRAVAPLLVARPLTIGALDAAERNKPATLAVFAQRDPETEHIRAEDLHPIGCQAVMRVRVLYESGVHVVIQGIRWIELQGIEETPTHWVARVTPKRTRSASERGDDTLRAAVALVRERAGRLAKLTLPNPEPALALLNTLPADPLGHLVIVNLACAIEDKARYAAELDPIARMQLLVALLDQQLAQVSAG